MAIELLDFVRKPFGVQAVEVKEENMAEVAQWCRGEIRTEAARNGRPIRRYIKVGVKRPLEERQTKAYVGDFVVVAKDPNIRGFKVYTPRAFDQTYDELVADMEEVLGRMEKRAAEEEQYEENDGFAEELHESYKRA